jgi:hypothetical protein
MAVDTSEALNREDAQRRRLFPLGDSLRRNAEFCGERLGGAGFFNRLGKSGGGHPRNKARLYFLFKYYLSDFIKGSFILLLWKLELLVTASGQPGKTSRA